MKKETTILIVVIAFVAGFVTGATVAILKEKKAVDRTVSRGAPLAVPSPPPGPSPTEVASRIKNLKEMVRKDPNNLPAWAELGNLYFDSNQPEEAIKAYSQYLKLKPDNPDVRTDMGIMYRNLGDVDRALEEFRKAAQSDPSHVHSRYNIAIVLLHDKQDLKGAIRAWEEYLKVDPASERANRVRAQMENLRKMVK